VSVEVEADDGENDGRKGRGMRGLRDLRREAQRECQSSRYPNPSRIRVNGRAMDEDAAFHLVGSSEEKATAVVFVRTEEVAVNSWVDLDRAPEPLSSHLKTFFLFKMTPSSAHHPAAQVSRSFFAIPEEPF